MTELDERLFDSIVFRLLFGAGHNVTSDEQYSDTDRRDHPDQDDEAEYRRLPAIRSDGYASLASRIH
ncbi:hypothetical protein [Natrinema sp. DC36]|uniref:hypothetical protein n=1 Tax=Natrinema sp. DC36 TaxID=2878680 RepID=UPI001CF03694|nr:hypothetical protein [Natrinema sp. DC36]